jgi:hypothetical protein
MSSESVYQVARILVDVGNFDTRLVASFMIFYSISPGYLRYSLVFVPPVRFYVQIATVYLHTNHKQNSVMNTVFITLKYTKLCETQLYFH